MAASVLAIFFSDSLFPQLSINVNYLKAFVYVQNRKASRLVAVYMACALP